MAISCSKPHQGLFLKQYGAQMLFLLQVYYKVSSFFYFLLFNTYSLQYRLALSVSDACSCKQRPYYVQNTSDIVSDSNVSDSAVDPQFRYYVISDANLDQLRCSPIFRDFCTEEKREGFIF